jgi:hypothetical protein
VLTSNATRELSEALKRRCLYLHLDYPTAEREKAIVLSRVPEIAEQLAEQLVRTVRSLRSMELKKSPSVAESIDWARTLLALGWTPWTRRPYEHARRGAQARQRPHPGRHAARPGLTMPGAGQAAGLLERQIGFVGALRDAGLHISLAEVLDATRALGVVDLREREQLRAGYAASLLKRPAHRQAFDALFDLWFPAVTGEPQPASGGPGEDPASDEDGPAGEGAGDGRADVAALREQLKALLLDGDEEALRRFARQSVRQLGRAETQPGRQTWFSYRVLRGCRRRPCCRAAGPGAGRPGARRAGERVARQTLTERIRRFSAAGRGRGAPAAGRGPRPEQLSKAPCSRWPSRWTSCGPAATTWPSCAGRSSRWPAGWPPG